MQTMMSLYSNRAASLHLGYFRLAEAYGPHTG